MIDYKLEHIFSYTGSLVSPAEIIGPSPEGIRVNFYSSGGEIQGPAIRGKVRPVGGDWVTVRKDGIAVMTSGQRSSWRMAHKSLVTYPGIIDFGTDGYDKFLRGEMPSQIRMRTSPRFSTSNPQYEWLNRLHCIGIGEYEAAVNTATYDVYAVR